MRAIDITGRDGADRTLCEPGVWPVIQGYRLVMIGPLVNQYGWQIPGITVRAMTTVPALYILSFPSIVCGALVVTGAAVQVAVGAGLSVISGPFLLLWLGAVAGVPILLCLNVIVSVMATLCGGTALRWGDVILASGATIAGCVIASRLPPFSDRVLRGMTACVLVAAALPRPPAPGILPSPASAKAGISLAGLVTGALTVWTATPGPITPVALARAGISGAEIRKAMQPISLVGYGVALFWIGGPPGSVFGTAALAWLIVASLLGTGLGFVLRTKIEPTRVVFLIRIVAGTAALLLVISLFR